MDTLTIQRIIHFQASVKRENLLAMILLVGGIILFVALISYFTFTYGDLGRIGVRSISGIG